MTMKTIKVGSHFFATLACFCLIQCGFQANASPGFDTNPPQMPDLEQGVEKTTPPAETASSMTQNWVVPSTENLRSDLSQWLEISEATPEIRTQSLLVWPENDSNNLVSPEILYETTVASLRLSSGSIAAYLNVCDSLEWNEIPFGQKLIVPSLPEQVLAVEAKISPRIAGTLKMYLTLRLIRTLRFDEAINMLNEMTPENTIDPIAVLFCKGIVCNQLLDKKAGIEAMKQFREAAEKYPTYSRRFMEVAKLVENELKELDEEKESPSNISKQMGNIKRRLGQGNTDKKVQDDEKGVLESLDKLIEKLEQQQKQGKMSQKGGQSNTPAEREQIMRQKGAGEVADKNIGDSDGWGNLPPKEREEALLRIEKDFPSHYRDIIEQFFRQMADRSE